MPKVVSITEMPVSPQGSPRFQPTEIELAAAMSARSKDAWVKLDQDISHVNLHMKRRIREHCAEAGWSVYFAVIPGSTGKRSGAGKRNWIYISANPNAPHPAATNNTGESK